MMTQDDVVRVWEELLRRFNQDEIGEFFEGFHDTLHFRQSFQPRGYTQEFYDLGVESANRLLGTFDPNRPTKFSWRVGLFLVKTIYCAVGFAGRLADKFRLHCDLLQNWLFRGVVKLSASRDRFRRVRR